MPDQNKQKKNTRKFPHIYRIFLALKTNTSFIIYIRSILSYLLVLGLVLFIGVNIIVQYQHQRGLLNNIDISLVNQEYVTVKNNSNSSQEVITRYKNLINKYPQYPDAYALLSLEYNQNRYCIRAVKAINTALKLDPGNQVYKDMKQTISRCQEYK
jgi:cytochrome c-type biogenesis protein CcmH/NrfG